MQKIEDGVYYEDSYPGVTLGAISSSYGVILIDAPLRTEDARTWRASLNTVGNTTNRILVNLDAHLDRTLGARALESTIVANQKIAQAFRNRPTVFKGQNIETGAEWEASNDVLGTRWALPDITFTQRMLLHWGGPETLLEHHPGPSLGATWAIVPEVKVIFVGDTVLPDQPPFLASADLPVWIESLEILKSSYKGYMLVSGRNGPVANEAVRAQIKYLKEILKSLERLAKRNSPPEMTEGLISDLLSDFKLTPKQRAYYAQRLRHGLYHYYSRHYRPFESPEEG